MSDRVFALASTNQPTRCPNPTIQHVTANTPTHRNAGLFLSPSRHFAMGSWLNPIPRSRPISSLFIPGPLLLLLPPAHTHKEGTNFNALATDQTEVAAQALQLSTPDARLMALTHHHSPTSLASLGSLECKQTTHIFS
jgi:hypothetical protein